LGLIVWVARGCCIDIFNLDSLRPKIGDHPWAYQNEFLVWYKAIIRKGEAKDVKERLIQLVQDSDPLDGRALIYCLFESCWCALNFDPLTDEMSKKRDKYKTAFETSKDYSSQLRKIAEQLGREEYGQASMAGYLLARDRNVTIKPCSGEMPTNEVWEILLLSLADSFDGFFPGHKVGAYEHMYSYGCVEVNKSLVSRHIPKVSTLLLFDLVYRLRLFSGGLSVIDAPSEMPDIGKPNYPLAAALVNLTFKIKISPPTARKNLQGFIESNAPTIKIWPKRLCKEE